jgi:ribosome-associated heat shock protein Hsp15
MESTRVDRWLHSVRVYKTRSLAASACEGGHVEVPVREAEPNIAVFVRDVGSGRPTKRDRRDLDRLRLQE